MDWLEAVAYLIAGGFPALFVVILTTVLLVQRKSKKEDEERRRLGQFRSRYLGGRQSDGHLGRDL